MLTMLEASKRVPKKRVPERQVFKTQRTCHFETQFVLKPFGELQKLSGTGAIPLPYRAIGYRLYPIALCFPGLAPYRAIPPIQTPIALTFACMQNKIRGVSHYSSYSIAVSRYTAPLSAKETPKRVPKQTGTKMPSFQKSKTCHFDPRPF